MNDNEDAPRKRKELLAVAFLAILGGNFTGLLNTVSPYYSNVVVEKMDTPEAPIAA